MNAQEIKEILDVLAERFGSTGVGLWAAIIRQVYIDAALGALWATLASAAGVILWRSRERFAEWVDGDFDREIAVPFYWIFAVVCGVRAIIGVDIASHVFNPEFFALRFVLGGAK